MFSCLSPYTSDTNTLITPANTITQIGFIFVFRSITTHMAKINTMTHFVPVKVIVLLPQKAVIRIKIPASGFPKEFGIADTMSSKSQKNYHYMTYTQMNDFVSQVKEKFDGYIGDITVKYLDKNNKSKTAKFNEVSEFDDYRFTSVNIGFNKDYPTSNSEKTVVFTYSTTFP